MSWVRINLTKDSLKEADDGTASAERTYYCESDVPVALDEALTAALDGDLGAVPQLADPFSETRPSCMVRSRDVSRLSPRQLEVKVSYQETPGGSWVTVEDLLAKPIRITRQKWHMMEPYDKDRSDPAKIVRNAAGDRFDHMPEAQRSGTVFVCKKYVNADGRESIEAVLDTTNAAAVVIDGSTCAIETLWLPDCVFEPVEGAEGVWEAQYQIHRNLKTWKDVVLNYGYYANWGEGFEHVRLTDTDGDGHKRPLTTPWPLDENGADKAKQTDDPSELTFRPYSPVSWAAVPVT